MARVPMDDGGGNSLSVCHPRTSCKRRAPVPLVIDNLLFDCRRYFRIKIDPDDDTRRVVIRIGLLNDRAPFKNPGSVVLEIVPAVIRPNSMFGKRSPEFGLRSLGKVRTKSAVLDPFLISAMRPRTVVLRDHISHVFYPNMMSETHLSLMIKPFTVSCPFSFGHFVHDAVCRAKRQRGDRRRQPRWTRSTFKPPGRATLALRNGPCGSTSPRATG
jgi:hypothetical protein